MQVTIFLRKVVNCQRQNELHGLTLIKIEVKNEVFLKKS